MAVPTTYLTSVKNVRAIFDAIKKAQAPPRFTTKFLEGLGFKSTSDRLVIAVLKMLGFLNDNGEPTPSYYEFLDDTQSGRVLADGIRRAYADLFQVNANAQGLARSEVKSKLKTLTQGQASESVVDKMAMTFKALTEMADFSETGPPTAQGGGEEEEEVGEAKGFQDQRQDFRSVGREPVHLGGLVYSIQLLLPESRDSAVYDALFKSLREHLL